MGSETHLKGRSILVVEVILVEPVVEQRCADLVLADC
jgi:hypothetical protein